MAGLELVSAFEPYGYLGRAWAEAWGNGVAGSALRIVKLHGSINCSVNDDDGRMADSCGIIRKSADHDIMIAAAEGDISYSVEPFSTLLRCFREDWEV